MEAFLRRTQSALKESNSGKIHVVLGNEACDLDSAASAVTYAFYLDTIKKDEDSLIVPVLNIPSADFRLRTEVTYYFGRVHIPLDLLTFRDQIDLDQLHKDQKLVLTLVDHNVLPASDKHLEKAVVEVIDHHQWDRPDNDQETLKIELVGSCCTLVAEILTTDDDFELDSLVAELLYGVVLLDTINLEEEAGRTTAKDIVMVDLLEGYRANDVPGRQVVFDTLEKAKGDVSALTCEEILRKDMKVISCPNVKIAMCSLPLYLEIFLAREDSEAALKKFSEIHETNAIVLMTLAFTEYRFPERQIAVYSSDTQVRAQCVDLLQCSSDPDLELTPMENISDSTTAFYQGNVQASRKRVLPYIKANASKIMEGSDGMISPSQDSGLALDSLSDPNESPRKTTTESPSDEHDPFSSVSEAVSKGEASLVDLSEADGAETKTPESKVGEKKPDVIGDEEDELSDLQPESTRPGGLLDLDFFEEAEPDHTSEAGSLGSLDDYSEEQEIELVPASTHESGKMLELISDALEDTEKPIARIEVTPAEGPKRVESESDLFEHHEGVLMGPSPLQGTTPECNLTPDTSQPTSPPNASYPSTPPNSFIDSSAMEMMKAQQGLPSFMNADMIRRIEEKKAGLSVIDEDNLGEDGNYPFTPQNSVSGSLASQNTWERSLPTIGNVDMIQAVHHKRKEFSGFEPQSTSDALKFPYTPPNSYAEGSPLSQHAKKGGHFNLMEEDFAARLGSKKNKTFDELEEEEEEEKADENKGDIQTLVDPTNRLAQEMKAQENLAKSTGSSEEKMNAPTDDNDEDIHKKVNPVDGNVVAYRIAQEMKAMEVEEDVGIESSEEVVPELLIPAVPKSDTMDELLSNADSLQAELAEAEEKSANASPVHKPNTDDDGVNATTSVRKEEGEVGGEAVDKTPSSSSKTQPSVKFAVPELEERQLEERIKTSDALGRPASESLVSEASTDDSELSQGIQEFLSRMRSDTGASAISGNIDDLMETAQHIEVARQIVDEAISSAVDVVKEDPPEKEELAHAGEWESAKMNKIHEAAMLDTTSSTSKEVDEMNSNTLTQRPITLESTPKKKIVPNLDLLRDEQDDSILANASASSSENDALDSFNDLPTPDDLTTPEAFGDSVFEGELDWEESENSDETPAVEPIPEYTAKEEYEDEKNWRSVSVGDRQFRIDMKVIEPYKKVLSHGGYYGDGFNAIIVFAGCYLPDKRRRDYHYVMDNLFLYVLSTLELLVVEDYMVVYFHGATPKQKMPSLRWLKRCYDMIDRRLKKNLKSLLIVHPTLWIRTIMTLTKPFISSKFSSKLKYVRSLKDLEIAVPMEYIFVPDEIKMFDAAKFRQNPPSPTAT